jgi:hypothetical protein
MGKTSEGKSSEKYQQPGRIGRVNVTGYFNPSVKKSLRLIQAKYPGLTLQDLLEEALSDLFVKHGVYDDDD